MSLITDDFKPAVNTLEEVKKLQDLVRKLEIQNLHLRNKQNSSKRRSVSPVKEIKSSNQFPFRVSQKCSETTDPEGKADTPKCIKDEYFDELDIIRVSDIEMSDDESWLYTSPNNSNQKHKNENPYKWLRKDVDDPENKQLQFAKNALLTKLTELDILSPPNVTSSHVENFSKSNSKRSQISCKSFFSTHSQDSIHIDSRTFTRSKKKQALEFLERLDLLNIEKADKNSLSRQLFRRGSDVSSDSVSSCHVLEDASDVEEVARMQEESLRMSSPLTTTKRVPLSLNTSSRKVSTSSHGSVSDQDLSESSILGASAVEDASGYESIENNSYIMESLVHSDESSPSESPYSSNMSLHTNEKLKGKLSGYRRSLPNLNKESFAARQSKINPGIGTVKQIPNKSGTSRKTDSYLLSSQKTRKENPSPLRVKTFNQKSVISNCQTVNIDESTHSVPRSAESSHLRIKSGLPRPSRASSASRSIPRSGIPMASLISKKQVEDSWSEGCF